MSLLSYFDRRKVDLPQPAAAANNKQQQDAVTVTSSSDEDLVYVEVVEKTKKILAKRKTTPDIVEVDRSSVKIIGESGDRQPVAVAQEPYRPTWSEKIAPQAANEVLGNEHNVKELLSWLKAWKKRRELIKKAQPEPVVATKRQQKSRKKKRKKPRKKANVIDSSSSSSSSSEDDWFNADPDFVPETRRVRGTTRSCRRGRDSEEEWLDGEDGGDSNQLCSTVLLTGPHGCGKTAAVFACAQELGYEILEINASSLRSGKQVISLLQEATQSHQVSQKSVESCGQSTKAAAAMRSFFKPAPPTTGSQKQTKTTTKPPVEAAPVSPAPAVSGFAGPSLILFEEVDILFEEDKGFWTALMTVAEASKRPIVITSLVDCLPVGLQYLSFPMEAPIASRISAHLQEKSRDLQTKMTAVALTRRDDISYAAAVCDGDLRRVMLNFELWLSTTPAKVEGEVDIPVSSFASWSSSSFVDETRRMAMRAAELRHSLLEHSQTKEEISPKERYIQLETTAALLESQSIADGLATHALQSREAAHSPHHVQPPCLSWQPRERTWWPAQVRPGLVDSVPYERADAISDALQQAWAMDMACAVLNSAVQAANDFISSTESSQQCSGSSPIRSKAIGDVNLDSGIASGGDESCSTQGDSTTTANVRLSTLTAEQESEFRSRETFYSQCRQWPHMPEIVTCRPGVMATDYLPMMRGVCMDQQIKKANKVKRRFIHHFNTMEADIATRLVQDFMPRE